jgi:hypothetical protein
MVEIIRDMSDKDYFALDAVNASTLKAMDNPELMKYKKDNPEVKECYAFGSVFHDWTLRNLTVNKCESVAISPFDSFRTKESKSWKTEQARNGIYSLSQKDADKWQDQVEQMAEAVYTMPEFVDEMNVSGREVVVLWDKEFKGHTVACKAKLDLFNPSSQYIYDLKSAKSLDQFDGSIFSFGYYISAAWYLEAARVAGAKATGFRFAVAGKDKPYQAILRELDLSHIAQGAKEIESLLERYILCSEKDCWPSPYSKTAEVVETPGWFINKMTQDIIELDD